jgi:hypothetical protein
MSRMRNPFAVPFVNKNKFWEELIAYFRYKPSIRYTYRGGVPMTPMIALANGIATSYWSRRFFRFRRRPAFVPRGLGLPQLFSSFSPFKAARLEQEFKGC